MNIIINDMLQLQEIATTKSLLFSSSGIFRFNNFREFLRRFNVEITPISWVIYGGQGMDLWQYLCVPGIFRATLVIHVLCLKHFHGNFTLNRISQVNFWFFTRNYHTITKWQSVTISSRKDQKIDQQSNSNC